MVGCIFEKLESKKSARIKFSEELAMKMNGYAALNCGDTPCCMMSFIMFLCFHCKDIAGFTQELRTILLKAQNDDCQDS